MSPILEQSQTACPPEPAGKQLWREMIRACLWIIPLIAVGVGVFLLVVQHARFSDAGRKFLASMMYATMIGVPSSIVLNWVGFRYTERFPRLINLINTVVLLGTATVGSLAAGLVFQWIKLFPGDGYWHEFTLSLPTSIVITLVLGLSISSFETMRHKLQSATLKLRTQQVEQERAYKLLAEARLSSLASRIHPHFLFNTLNSIASLIPSDPKRAEDTVGKLASLLRFSLRENQTGLVPLSQELKIVRDYLEIERTRFGPRLRYKIDAPAELDRAQVPPLALQTLVENSIKHVVSQRAEGATIHVAVSSEDGRVRLQVIDDGPGFSLQSITPEHGLGNLVSRLELLFGERGQLSVARQDETTVVTLLFPLES
jgi:two-component system, LytTR family, sensor histidine kinase AlgZ